MSFVDIHFNEAKEADTCPISYGSMPYKHQCGGKFKHQGDHYCFDKQCSFTWPNRGFKLEIVLTELVSMENKDK